MRNMFKIMKRKDVGSIGIGAMIVFIAMVLVAGIAASVLIQTSTRLEAQAMQTGRETTKEVATGVAVYDIEGFTDNATEGLKKMVIMLRPRAGSNDIDLQETYIELSNSSKKVILKYDIGYYADAKPTGHDDVFENTTVTVFPAGADAASQFGVLVIEDADGSFVSNNQVVMNRGDKAFLCINLTACFGGLQERTDIWGMVVPEIGSPGIISFKTPASFSGSHVFDLQ